MPLFIQSNGFLTACRNTAADCIIFLTVGNSWLRQQTSKVASLYHWAFAGMTKGNRLWERKRNVLRREGYFYFHHYSFQISLLTKREVNTTGYMAKFLFFLHFVRLSKSPLFFSWLVTPLRSLAARPPSPVASKNKTDNNIITTIMIKSLFTNSDYNKSS